MADGGLEVLLAHPGGPFFARKDAGSWTIPKGLVEPGEEPMAAARREFEEEMGWAPPPGAVLLPLPPVRLKSGKTVLAWAFETTLQQIPPLPGTSTFTLVWPPKSGRVQTYPEIDRAAFFPLADAAVKLAEAQLPFLAALQAYGGAAGP